MLAQIDGLEWKENTCVSILLFWRTGDILGNLERLEEHNLISIINVLPKTYTWAQSVIQQAHVIS